MTERLATLLREEAELLEIPSPPADAVLTQGRGLRRRRTATRAVAAVAVVAAGVAGGAAITSQAADSRRTIVSPAAQAYLNGGAFSVGSTIYFGDAGEYRAHVDEKIKVLYYTSAGVLARTGTSPWTDSEGPSHFSLVTPDGTVTQLDLDLGDRVPATDPTTPYLAYSVADGDGWDIVVRNVNGGDIVAQVPVPGERSEGGWESPPVAIYGDFVYVAMKNGVSAVNWHTGTVSTPAWFAGETFPEVSGGHFSHSDADAAIVSDAATGAELLRVPVGDYGWLDLSPDGRYAKLVSEEGPNAPVKVYDVAAGTAVSFPQLDGDVGWAPDGHLIGLAGDTLTTCDPASGSCESTDVAIERVPSSPASTTTEHMCFPDKDTCTDDQVIHDQDENNVVKIGGNAYES